MRHPSAVLMVIGVVLALALISCGGEGNGIGSESSEGSGSEHGCGEHSGGEGSRGEGSEGSGSEHSGGSG